ncbi:MAG: hypothetical protein C0623_11945 [Desulfuromonas sp.]|nr:MAG: hypothetical protein C0623_11945 [Desulfuromonas sp.]
MRSKQQSGRYFLSPESKHTRLIAPVSLFLLVLLLYSQGLNAGWYLDDYARIVNNIWIGDLGYALRHVFDPRGIAYLSFFVDYELFGMNPKWFHFVNIIIHACNVLLVHRLLRVLFKEKPWLTFFGAGLFALHPLQSQAVMYVVQRMALLSSLFFLLSLVFYIQYRTMLNGRDGFFSARKFWLVISLLCGFLSVFSKENTVVLPFFLILFDYALFRGEKWNFRETIKSIAPYMLLPVSVGVNQFLSAGSTVSDIKGGVVDFFLPVAEGEVVSRIVHSVDMVHFKYLLTQFWVVTKYIKLFFLPVGQVFEYAMPLIETIYDSRALFGFLFLSFLFGLGAALHRKKPLVFLGIISFFLLLATESTVIPLDTIYEHRMYLPSFGLIIAVLGFIETFAMSRLLAGIFLTLLIVCSILTLDRVSLWANAERLWQDNVSKVPTSSRARYWLAREYLKNNQFAKIVELLQPAETVFLDENNLFPLHILSEAYLQLGLHGKALDLMTEAQKKSPGDATVEFYKSKIAYDQSDMDRAQELIETALRKNPGNIRFILFKGKILRSRGRLIEAAASFNKVSREKSCPIILLDSCREYVDVAKAEYESLLPELEGIRAKARIRADAEPNNPTRRGEYAVLLQQLGFYDKAIEQYGLLERHFGENWQIYYNYAQIYTILERRDLAEANFKASLRLNPESSRVLNSYGLLSKNMEKYDQAVALFLNAIKQRPDFAYAYFNLAETYFKMGQKENARKYFGIVFKRFPELRPVASPYLEFL